MSLETLDLREHEEKRKILWCLIAKVGGGIALGALLLLGLHFGSGLVARLNEALVPAPRENIRYVMLLDNSGSAIGWNLKSEAMHEAVAISQAIGHPVTTLVERLGHQPVEIYREVNRQDNLIECLNAHYIKTNQDPVAGTNLSPALEDALKQVEHNPSALLVISVAADSFDDPTEARAVVKKLHDRGHVLLIHHAVPIHDPHTSHEQLRMREESRKALAPLGDDAVIIGKTEFPQILQGWLPRKLKVMGYQP